MTERLSFSEQHKLAKELLREIRSTNDSLDWGFILQRRQELSIKLREKRIENDELKLFLSLTVGLRDVFGKHYSRVTTLWEKTHCYPFPNLAK